MFLPHTSIPAVAAIFLILAACEPVLDWTAPSSGVDTDPTEVVCYPPVIEGGPMECVEL